ncbi:Rv1733c family protein [Pseudonocardia phyllosphaerae]|uniref:Rv1733c family protein n=1 Tax=Pseudonocardia phyllosphaerae TaxID=3390502 RepID=UPI00397E0E22
MRTGPGPGRTDGPHAAVSEAVRMHRRATRWRDVLVVVLGLVAACGLVLAALAAWSSYEPVHERAAAEKGTRIPVRGVVVHRASSLADLQAGQQAATVSWPGPDGRPRTGDTALGAFSDVGDQVLLWTDRSGALTAPPTTDGDAIVVAVTAGLLTLVGSSLLLALCWRGGVRWTGTRLDRAWELGWAAVEPEWSGRRRA